MKSRGMALTGACLLAVLLGAPIAAAQPLVTQSRAPDGSVWRTDTVVQREAAWTVSVTQITDGPEFCGMEVRSGDGIRPPAVLKLGQNATRDGATLMYHGDGRYSAYHGTVSVEIDAGPPFEFAMESSEAVPDLLYAEPAGGFSSRFIEQLRGGRTMVVSQDGQQQRRFSLAGSARAVAMMAACIFTIGEDYRNGTRVHP